MADHSSGTWSFYNHIIPQVCHNLHSTDVNTLVPNGEVPVGRKKHASFTSEEPISKCVGGLTICLGRFSHAHYWCIVS